MKRVIYLSTGQTLADLLKQVADEGWDNLDKVVIEGDYTTNCCGHSEGEYCYCEGGYTDMRLEKRK